MTIEKIERKRVNFVEISAEKKDSGNGAAAEMRFKGYGAVFGNMDSYGDVIEQGAFEKTLKAAEKSGNYPAMLLQHGGWGVSADDYMPIGVWASLTEDKKGLVSEGVLAPIQRGIDAYTLLTMKPRPAISGLSIGYIAKKFTIGSKPEEPRRLLHEVELMEISLVTWPANDKARISSVKSGADCSDREFEQLMQDAGLSRKEARVVLTHGFRHLKAMQDAGSVELDDLATAIKRNTTLIQTA